MTVNIDSLTDFHSGRQHRSIYADPKIYELEQERIFGRCWLFLAHEQQIPSAGDFFRTFMGEDEVLVVRQKNGSVKAFLNTCTHRGNRLCKADTGNKKAFVCNYHGWGFDMSGALTGVPLEKEAYYGELDKDAFKLIEVAQLSSYNGLIFGNFDPEAPSLEAYLGEMRWYLDIWLDAMPNGTALLGETMKVELPVNWKFPVENVSGDGYHLGWAHAGAMTVSSSMSLSGMTVSNSSVDNSAAVSVAGLNGHCVLSSLDGVSGYAFYPQPKIAIDYLEQNRAIVAKRLGKVRAEKFWGSQINLTVFPSLQLLPGLNWFRVYHPKGVDRIEMWTWAMVDVDMPNELKEMILANVARTFGPAGIFDNDDGDNLQACSELSNGRQTRKMNLYTNMALGREHSRDEMPGVVSDGLICEQNQRYVYRRWSELMRAENWSDVPIYNNLEEANKTLKV